MRKADLLGALLAAACLILGLILGLTPGVALAMPPIPPLVPYVAPGGVVDLTNKLTLTTAAVTPTSAQKSANWTLILNALAACNVTVSSGTQLTAQPAGEVKLPGGMIDIGPNHTGAGIIGAQATAGWGCKVTGVPGRTMIRTSATDVRFFDLVGHRAILDGVAMIYATAAARTAADLQNWDLNHGQQCVGFVYLVQGRFTNNQCYNAAQMYVVPMMDSTAYGNAIAGQDAIFSDVIESNYTAANSDRCGSIVATRTATFTGTISSNGTVLTIDSGSLAGSPVAAGQTVYSPTVGGITPETITGGSGLAWTLSGSTQNVADGALQSSAIAQGGTDITKRNNYCGGNAGYPSTATPMNMGWVTGGIVTIDEGFNFETSAWGASTPAIGAGGDGANVIGADFVGVPGGYFVMGHHENLIATRNNAGLFSGGSGTNVTIVMPDWATLNCTTANGCTNLYLAAPYGGNSYWHIIGANEGGAVPGNTLTNNIGLISPQNTLTNTVFDFDRIFAWQPATQLNQTASVPTNDKPVLRTETNVDTLTSAAAGGTAPAGVTMLSLHANITVTGLTLAAGQAASALTVTATNNINTLSNGARCDIRSYAGAGKPELVNPTFGNGTFSFQILNGDAVNALNANLVAHCDIDNG